MSTNVEGINYGSGTVLNGLTTPGGLSYVWAWDTTNLYLRFFDGATAGGKRVVFYSDLPASTVTSFNGRTGAVAPASGDYAVAQITGAAPFASPALTGTPTAPTAAANTSTTQLATTAFVLGQAAATTPTVDGTAATGSSTNYARADHVHPTDTSRLATAGGTITGALAISDNTASAFTVGTAYDLCVDSSSNHYLLIGTNTAKSNVLNASGAASTPTLQKYATSATGASFGFIGDINSGNGPMFYLAKGRSAGAIVTSGDTLGNILFSGSDGTNYVCGVELVAVSEGTPAAASMASRLAIYTNRAANTATEAARFDSSGNFAMGGANIVVDANRTFYNRPYTIAALPATGLVAGQQVACSNLGNGSSASAAGGVLDALECDGANWRWSSQAAGPLVLITATGAVSWTPLVSSPLVYFNAALTGAVTLTLGTGTAPAAAWKGMRVRVVRGAAATGGSSLTIANGGAGGTSAPYANKALSSAASWADFEFEGTNWYQAAAGSL